MIFNSKTKTYNIDAQVADSAGTATAYLSGVKTRIGSIGVDGTAVDCKTSLNAKVDSILKWAHYAGKSTGIVTTTRLITLKYRLKLIFIYKRFTIRVTHATPAGTYSHVPNRQWESYDGTNFNSTHFRQGCKDIAAQLVDDNSFINLVFGGGRNKFLSKTSYELNSTYSESGDRIDARNLISDWIDKMKNENKRFNFLWNKTSFDLLKPNEYDHILGNFIFAFYCFDAIF